MNLFFIRHGETIGDVENRYGGTYDDHLSEKGIEQVKALAQTLHGKGIQVIFSSPLIRAQETSQLLADILGCPVQTVADLRERNQYSFLSGFKKDEAAAQYPDEVELLKDRLNTIEGAESYENFSKRIVEAFQSIANAADYESVAIVSHGGPVRALFRDMLRWGEMKEIGDCAFVELEKTDGTFVYRDSSGLLPIFSFSAHAKS